MKKLLLPIFSSVLLTSSATLTAGTNVNTGVKLAEKEKTIQEFIKTSQQVNIQSELNEDKIKEIQINSQNWNNEEIEYILNQALEYHNHQLIINQDKLDFTKLPPEILNYLDLILVNLNNAVSAGYIQPYIINDNLIELNYPNKINTFSNYDNEIIDFDSQNNMQQVKASVAPFSSYMWYSTYGPSAWWKFWEWGGYLHFSEHAVQVAKPIYFISTILDLIFLIKNVKKLSELTTKLTAAKSTGNTAKIKSLMPELSKLLGNDIGASLMGILFDNLAVLVMVVTFFLAITTTPGFGAFFLALGQLFISATAKVTGDMIAGWSRPWSCMAMTLLYYPRSNVIWIRKKI